ncbi:MAG: hypothetical protein ACMXX7_00770 [Candidatus Woesearchaeota archaeon]
MFQKSFAKSSDKSVYPKWVEVTLSEKEEKEAESLCRKENYVLMAQCLEDAKGLVLEKKLMESQSNIVGIAVALFEKRASHAVFYKERIAKQKFDDSM